MKIENKTKVLSTIRANPELYEIYNSIKVERACKEAVQFLRRYSDGLSYDEIKLMWQLIDKIRPLLNDMVKSQIITTNKTVLTSALEGIILSIVKQSKFVNNNPVGDYGIRHITNCIFIQDALFKSFNNSLGTLQLPPKLILITHLAQIYKYAGFYHRGFFLNEKTRPYSPQHYAREISLNVIEESKDDIIALVDEDGFDTIKDYVWTGLRYFEPSDYGRFIFKVADFTNIFAPYFVYLALKGVKGSAKALSTGNMIQLRNSIKDSNLSSPIKTTLIRKTGELKYRPQRMTSISGGLITDITVENEMTSFVPTIKVTTDATKTKIMKYFDFGQTQFISEVTNFGQDPNSNIIVLSRKGATPINYIKIIRVGESNETTNY